MKYWYGYRAFNQETDAHPGAKMLRGPFNSYQETKNDRNIVENPGFQRTEIFLAQTKKEAEEKLDKEGFKYF